MHRRKLSYYALFYLFTFLTACGGGGDNSVPEPPPPANNAPVISGVPPATVMVNEAYSFIPTATDPDGDALSFSVANLPFWADFDTRTGALVGTPEDSVAGTSYNGITITVSDAELTAELTFSIFVQAAEHENHAPNISGLPATQATVNQAYSFTPIATDPDGDALIFSAVNLPPWADFDTVTGTVSGTPGSAEGGNTYSDIRIAVSDGELSAELSFSLKTLLTNYAGVPDPLSAFGYDPYTLEIPADPDNWPSQEAPNFYYVDPSDRNATDSDNPYGYPDKPRATFEQFSVAAGGKVVLVGDGNSYNIGGSGRFEPTLEGSAIAPVFIEGRFTTMRPELVKQLRFSSATHVIVDGLMWTQNGQNVVVQGSTQYLTIRNSVFDGPSTDVGFKSVIALSGASVSSPITHVVIFNNLFRDWGENITTSPENDYHGVKPVAYATQIWVINNECHNLGGDCIQVGNASIPDDQRPDHVYIAGNLMYNNLENCVDIKEADDIIISGNTCHTFNRQLTNNVSGHSDTAMVIHNGSTNVWVLNNTIHNVGTGVINTEGINVNILGNLIYNVNPVGSYNPDTAYGNGQCIHARGASSGVIAFNTCANYTKGINFGGVLPYLVYGNIFSSRNRVDGYEIMLANSSDYSGFTGMDFNLFYNATQTTQFKRGGDIENLPSWNASTGFENNVISSDPQFSDIDSHNFSLRPNSPAIDATDTELQIFTDFQTRYSLDIRRDINGVLRPQNSEWDRGAFEAY